MKKYKTYIFGFILCLILTFASYFVVSEHVNSSHQSISHETLIPLILVFAVAQLIVQLIFFLHLLSKRESGRNWRIIIFISTISIILVIIFGSLWIMDNLNYHMTPKEVRDYILEQDRL